MTDLDHVLVVRAAGMPWAVPMGNVEETFSLTGQRVHQVGDTRCLVFRRRVTELHDLAEALGLASTGEANAAVIVWAGGRRCAFSVDSLVGQMHVERVDLPALTRSPYCLGAALGDDEVIPILNPGVVAGEYGSAISEGIDLDDMQRSALAEVTNIGSGNAATSLAQLLGREIDIDCPEAAVVTVAEAADRVGQPAETWAMVDTPVHGGGRVLLLFPGASGHELCTLLGASLDEEMGRSALREVGNILSSAYLIAIGQMTGLEFEPEPPTIQVGLLGTMLEGSLRGVARASDLTVLMRSQMFVGGTDAGFSFLFVPNMEHVGLLLDRLGLGLPAAA